MCSGSPSLLDATPEEASFLGNEKYFEDFLHTSAGIVLVPPGLPKYPENVAFVEVANPSMAFNALVKYFKASSYKFVPGIHPSAVIDPSAKINPDKVRVGAYTCIGAHCEIGDGTDIGNGCQIGDGVTMGETAACTPMSPSANAASSAVASPSSLAPSSVPTASAS